jgi:diguanylate cyclase (GGDEF)-like protein
MTKEYFFFYCMANAFCIVIFVMLLLHDWVYSTRQEKQIWFDRTVISHILYFLSDIGWAAILSGQLPRTRFLVILFNMLNFVFLGMIACGWFMYMAASEKIDLRKRRRRNHLVYLPLFLSFLVMAGIFIIKPSFLVNRNGELNFWYYPLMLAAPLFYILSSSIISIINAKKADNLDDRRLYVLIAIYPISVVVFGLLQLSVLDAPLFCFGCTIMMLFFYIQSLQSLISVDSLTRLNNRGQIDRYIKQVRYRDNPPVWGIMIDVDRFKQINDTYGHAEGDRALVLVSDALRQTADQMKTKEFIGRYGGDEFTIIVQATEEEVSQMISSLREILRSKQQENNLPYELKLSIGCEPMRDANDTMAACLNRADQKLYEFKRKA